MTGSESEKQSQADAAAGPLATKGAWMLARGGHHGQVRTLREYDAPSSYQAVCSCGWEGVVMVAPYYSKVFDQVVAQYGLDAVLEPGSAHGGCDEARADMLSHLGYEPGADLAQAWDVLRAATQELAALTGACQSQATGESGADVSQVVQAAAAAAKAAAGLEQAHARAQVHATVAVPVAAQVSAQARAAYEEAAATLRVSYGSVEDIERLTRQTGQL